VLERAGLISRSRSAQTRPCRLKAAPLKEVAQWVEVYRNLWDESFDRLDTFLQSTQPTPAASNDKTGAKPTFIITRLFKAARARVWKARSEADRLNRWWGPKGCSIEVLRDGVQVRWLLSLRHEIGWRAHDVGTVQLS
jgi:hypothetical protein